jgi:hypothetical protein
MGLGTVLALSAPQQPVPDPADEILGSADAGSRRAFDDALKIVEAVGVLARERQVPGRLAKPTLHPGEVTGLFAV